MNRQRTMRWTQCLGDRLGLGVHLRVTYRSMWVSLLLRYHPQPSASGARSVGTAVYSRANRESASPK